MKRRRYMDILSVLAMAGVTFCALCWTLVVIEIIDFLPELGFDIEHNLVHGFGVLFIAVFVIFFPLGWYMRRIDYHFSRWRYP